MPRQPGTVHLVGGGRDEDAVVLLFARFVEDAAAARSGGSGAPGIHALLVLEDDDDETVERFRSALSLAGADVSVHAIEEGAAFDATALDGADGIFVGGGLTPAYHAAFAKIGPLVHERVAAGTPYLGFSAGAAIAAERAVIGGYLIDGVVVCDEDAGEELDDVTVVTGLGLVPFSVDVHAAQWGTVSRLVAAATAGLVGDGVAIDEHTAVEWRSDGEERAASVHGRGAAWHVTRGDAGAGPVTVDRRTAGSV
ncbi:Type 1 glutamine amidotransferase-like domain-containing protein [Microbacterium sp. 2FI]|uniref:Type 1 glutamine amidotransferase-like domain-containing protein n=1 Tax=Microbacterium sp. 2FI TaxID=2502193 RepID=UPI0010F43C72|nr:Type 1 glutamine amidotransferase-like domain-containing protein [Microbacterium sp. 2FI]